MTRLSERPIPRHACISTCEACGTIYDHAALVAAVDGLRNPFTWFTPHAAYEQARKDVLALLNTLPAAPTIDPQKGDTHRVDSDQDTST